MDIFRDKSGLPPMQLTEESTFKFACHEELPCFTRCCREINITLTPYDIIRLKNRLHLTSDQFLESYTVFQMLEKTDLPVVMLKLLDDEEKSCPFVREEGCTVYEDRPATCRYYPLGVGTLMERQQENRGFYFFVHEPHCRGFEEDREWTVAEWRKNQGVDVYDEINAGWTELIVRKRSMPPNIHLTEKTRNMFFTASYDIDRFRRFVFESSFLSLYDIDKETVERIREDEIELLKFGFRWLKWLLFKQGDFRMNEREAEARRKRMETPSS